jgi:hypothetical protein
MAAGSVATIASIVLAGSLCSGCSLILDFSEGAVPKDAAIDQVYTQEQCDYLEPNDALAAPATASALDTGTAAICLPPMMGDPEDHDFYRFTNPAASLTVSITFTNRPGGDLDIKLYDPMGTMISQSRGFGDMEQIVCPGTAPACPTVMVGGAYTLEVFGAVAGSVNTYKFSVP